MPPRHSRRAIPRSFLGPLCDLAQPNAMLDRRSLNNNDELRRGGRGGDDLVLPELCNCQRDGFIQGFSLHVSRMDD